MFSALPSKCVRETRTNTENKNCVDALTTECGLRSYLTFLYSTSPGTHYRPTVGTVSNCGISKLFVVSIIGILREKSHFSRLHDHVWLDRHSALHLACRKSRIGGRFPDIAVRSSLPSRPRYRHRQSISNQCLSRKYFPELTPAGSLASSDDSKSKCRGQS